MVSFEWYQFKELRQMQNSKKPQNTHLFHEMNSSASLYLVDSSDNTKWLKTTDEGITVSTAYTCEANITKSAPDRTNGYVYFLNVGASGADHTEFPDEINTFDIFDPHTWALPKL